MNQYSIIQSKSLSFAIDIIELYKFLIRDRREYVISKQILKSGTSIGANVEEGIGGVTPKDKAFKFSIAYKESRETKYWLKLLKASNYITEETFNNLDNKCEELLKISATIITNNTEKSNKKIRRQFPDV